MRSGAWKGHTGKRIRNVVNIGIGGSDLGPVMAYEALKHYSDRAITFRFVSNVDGTDLAEAVRDLDPAETLFIVSSKTFTTLETMTNARTARDWLLAAMKADEHAIARHFVAVSTNARGGGEVRHRHRQHVRILGLGRRPLFHGFGHRPFDHAGHRARQFPRHAGRLPCRWTSISARRRSSATCRSCMGLLAIWYNNFFGAQTVAVLPYDQYLKRFPAYLQQLTMESNGKHVTLDGARVDYDTGPDLLGRAGTNGQHSFYQLIHQGTRLIPCDFIAFAHSPEPARPGITTCCFANVFAQTEALAFGKTAEEVRAGGNAGLARAASTVRGQPSVEYPAAGGSDAGGAGQAGRALRAQRLHPGHDLAGRLLRSVGRGAGQGLAQRIIPELESASEPKFEHDSSTNALIRRYRKLKGPA